MHCLWYHTPDAVYTVVMHSDVCYDHEKLEFHVCCMFMCIGVSGDARRQECVAPPTTTGPHVVEHPTGDMRYGKHVYVLQEHYQ